MDFLIQNIFLIQKSKSIESLPNVFSNEFDWLLLHDWEESEFCKLMALAVCNLEFPTR